MLEILITLFLLTMWLLASAGVQSSSLQFNKAAQFRTQAVYLATELAERMQANKTAAVAGGYVYSGTGATSSTDCTDCTTLCSSDDLAAFDLAEWSNRVTATLPNGYGDRDPRRRSANPITYTIVISWTDRRDDRAYSELGYCGVRSPTRRRKTVFNAELIATAATRSRTSPMKSSRVTQRRLFADRADGRAHDRPPHRRGDARRISPRARAAIAPTRASRNSRPMAATPPISCGARSSTRASPA